MTGDALVVGIGSPHGDDQVGWLVARNVAQRLDGGVTVRCARAPAELLDWLHGVDRLFLCDALQSEAPPGSVRQWNWPAAEIANVRFAGSHDLPLAAALQLGESLGMLPRVVRIWGVSIAAAQPLTNISADAAAVVSVVADQICRHLRAASKGARADRVKCTHRRA
ncbi:MAG: hydrogenase maturation protease [Pirellulales bacterium]